jgi:hypothetical protein
MSKRNIFRTIWLSIVVIFSIWNWNSFQSHHLPEGIFIDSQHVTVEESEDEIVFRSETLETKSEIIFFQGGMTDPKAYAPLCRNFAESGYTCHLIKMDWRLPQYDYHKVYKLLNLENGNWVIGGHSQGAKMAVQMAYENAKLFKGLFLLGTSHPRDINLSSLSIPCIKLFAEHDGLASVEEVMSNQSKLPKNAISIMIKGGNHSQFGYLGQLLMDGKATISTQEQQKLTFGHLLDFVNQI